MNYYEKYLKYKNKYLELKNFLNGGGADGVGDTTDIKSLSEIKFIRKDSDEYKSLLAQIDSLTKSVFGDSAYGSKYVPDSVPGIVVCIKDEKLIGILFIDDCQNYNRNLIWWGGLENTPSSLYGSTYFLISCFCIDESYRSNNIGTRMLDFTKELALKNGYNNIYLYVDYDFDYISRKSFYVKNKFYISFDLKKSELFIDGRALYIYSNTNT